MSSESHRDQAGIKLEPSPIKMRCHDSGGQQGVIFARYLQGQVEREGRGGTPSSRSGQDIISTFSILFSPIV